MNPWEVLGRERAPDGGELVRFRGGGDEFMIRVGRYELMSSRASNSEEEMARLAIARLAGRPGPRILIGGLGRGFTTRTALDALPPNGEVVVAEIVGAAIAWSRGPLAHLAGRPLEDPRVHVEPMDVGRLMATTGARFDAILLDVDNGPQGLTRKANHVFYAEAELHSARRALRAGALLAVWSAGPDDAFETGFETETVTVSARGAAGGALHTLFFGLLPSPSAASRAPTKRRDR